jgi:hypothetical protein
VVVVVVAVMSLLHWLYLRSSKEAGRSSAPASGRMKVVSDGGCLCACPSFNDVIPVNMNTLRLELSAGAKRRSSPRTACAST